MEGAGSERRAPDTTGLPGPPAHRHRAAAADRPPCRQPDEGTGRAHASGAARRDHSPAQDRPGHPDPPRSGAAVRDDGTGVPPPTEGGHDDGFPRAHASPPAPRRDGAGRDGTDGASGLTHRRGDAPVIPLTTPPRLFRTAFPARPSCAADVRRMVATQLRIWRLAPLVDDAVLATDELFSNAVRHASTAPTDSVAVTLEHSGGRLRVTLTDSSPALPVPRLPEEGAESGRGLSIVAALADDWGTEPPGPGRVGKKVWFALSAENRP